jgi:hypothetical protein
MLQPLLNREHLLQMKVGGLGAIDQSGHRLRSTDTWERPIRGFGRWWSEGLGDQRGLASSECIEHSQLSKVSLIPSLVRKVSPCFRFLGRALPVAIPIRHRVKNFKVPGALSSENFKRSIAGICSNPMSFISPKPFWINNCRWIIFHYVTNMHCADSMFLCGFEYFYFHQSRLAFYGSYFLGQKNFCGRD